MVTPAPPRAEGTSEIEADRKHVAAKLAEAQAMFLGYQATHAGIQEEGLDPDGGEFEVGQIEQMRQTLAALEEAVAGANASHLKRVMEDEGVSAAHARLLALGLQAREALVHQAPRSLVGLEHRSLEHHAEQGAADRQLQRL